MISPVVLSVVVGGAEWQHPSLRPAAAWDSCGTGSWWLQTVHSSTSAQSLTELHYTCSRGGGGKRGKEVEEEVWSSLLFGILTHMQLDPVLTLVQFL